MQLNRSAFNSSPLNGTRRLAVTASADALVAPFGASLTATRRARGAGTMTFGATTELSMRALRQGSGTAVFPVRAELQGQAVRFGRATAFISLGTSLFYTRTKNLEGAFLIDLSLRGDVGVIFVDGSAVFHPATVELAPNRKRWNPGAAAIAFDGDLAASATRRTTGQLDLEIDGGLDPAHRRGGVRYLTAGMRAPIQVRAQDAGMSRGSQLGDIHFELHGSGTASSTRALSGVGSHRLLAESDWAVMRMARPNPLPLPITARLDGEIHVRGDGQARLAVAAPTMAGTVYKRADCGAAVFGATTDLDGHKLHLLEGDAPLGVETDLVPERRAVPDMRAPLGVSAGLDASAVRVGDADFAWPCSLDTALAGEVQVWGEGTMVVSTRLEGDLARTRLADCHDMTLSAVIEGQGNRVKLAEGAARLVTLIAPMEDLRLATLDGEGAVGVSVDLTGQRYARASGEFSLEVNAPDLDAVRAVTLGSDPLSAGEIALAGNPVMLRAGDGTVDFMLNTSLDGIRVASLDGEAAIEVITSSSGYLNPTSDDIASQHFERPATQRVFERVT